LSKFGVFGRYSDYSILDDEADMLCKMRTEVEKFRKHNKLSQEAMIPWRGCLKFRTYNPGKLVKYGILAHMVCEAITDHIGNMEMYTAESKKVEGTICSVLEPNLNLWHHVYQNIFYNSVEIAEKLLQRKKQVCRTVRANTRIPN
jgi:hypothetical protein